MYVYGKRVVLWNKAYKGLFFKKKKRKEKKKREFKFL